MSIRAIIADDLTGAMDTGVLFAKRYPRVSVLFDKSNVEEMVRQNDALIIDSESRNTTAGKAYSIVREYTERLEKTSAELIYKKIDSTLRGNIGKELEVIVDVGAFDMVALVPALPISGRTTLNGFLYVNGRLLMESDLASDPFSPIKSSYIPDIVKAQTQLKVAVVELNTIRSGSSHLIAVLDELHRTGCRVAVMDVENEGDMDCISTALNSSGLKILPCGSAGLFSRMFTNKLPELEPMELSHIKNDKPLVVISGSPAKISKLQIEYAQNQGENVIKLDCEKIIGEADAASDEINRVKRLSLEYLGAGKNIIIDGAGTGKKDINDTYKGDTKMLLEASRKVQAAISDITEEIADNVEISGLMIFGGDTALSICRKLQAKAVRILGEVEPLVPYGKITGGKLDGVYIATKAGGFGTEDIILKAAEFF